ncbi:hypothetical protein [Streptomyces sp. HSG2]|uniref:hypothetical protein n=1 Tax=Streptomyces sp. HSG2 TaxID=2797167 RepID=UPI001908F82C|nr:hypothetical protein [Streptomyces sp. HSG2]
MSGDRDVRRRRGSARALALSTAAAVLAVPTSGCVVVHGERAVLPAATRAEATAALERFTTAYNEADRAYDPSLDAPVTTGALADIDSARLRAGAARHPDGNPRHTPLELTDVRYTIPKKAGWPRWFVADALGDKGGDARWLLVFTRDGIDEAWEAAYLALVEPDSLPEVPTDEDGWAEAVPAESSEPTISPGELSEAYTGYLQEGGAGFADGPHTSAWRELREKRESRPGLARQYIDEPLDGGDYVPLAVRTKGGGALVFFATRHYEKQTAARGATVPTPNQDVLALTEGTIEGALTMEFVSNAVALIPPAGAAGEEVRVLGRVQGLTSARGE